MNLNFSLFPDITRGNIFWGLPNESLKADQEIWNRSVAALYMLFKMGEKPPQEGLTQQINAEVHLRSALVEFVGIEELLQKKGYNFKIKNLENPLFHVMRLLRNYQVHFSNLETRNINVDVIFANEEQTWEVLVIDNLEYERLSELDAIKKHNLYSEDQVKEMVNYFNEQQHRIGVYDLLREGMHLYLNEIGQLITSRSSTAPSALDSF